jgi:hypothetical protein
MEWKEIRRTYPHRWLLVEALEAHSQSGKRILDDLAVVDSFPDGLELHHRFPERELYVLHTDREDLDIGELSWLGLRPSIDPHRVEILDARDSDALGSGSSKRSRRFGDAPTSLVSERPLMSFWGVSTNSSKGRGTRSSMTP